MVYIVAEPFSVGLALAHTVVVQGCVERSEDILSPMTNEIGLYLYLDNKTMNKIRNNGDIIR